MRRLVAILVPLALMAACSRGPSNEERFVTDVRRQVDVTDLDDDQVVGMGESTCDAFRAGLTKAELADAARSPDFGDPAGFMAIAGLAVRHLCPELKDSIN